MKKPLIIAPILLIFSICLGQQIDIQGRVVDKNGSPVKGAELKLIKARLSGNTDDQGRFHIRGGTQEASTHFTGPASRKISLYHGILEFQILKDGQDVRIEVFDRKGRKVNEVFKASTGTGTYRVDVFPDVLPFEVFIIKLRIGGATTLHKAFNLQGVHGRGRGGSLAAVNPLSKQSAYTTAGAVDFIEIRKQGYLATTIDLPSYTASLVDIVLQKTKPGLSGKGLPPITNGKEATTTRYWDCCKPHCAWKTGMKVCDIKGNVMHNQGAESGCRGGSVFQCFDYAPIEVSGRVSYGWAAFNNRGTNCGDCFQLDFKSQLKGRQMIVQIVNVGDGGKNAFDLLIPGGGVGKMNGCSRQWGNPPLGERYGGFHRTCKNKASCIREMCKKAFGDKADLMRGCEWYIDWFNMADNPKVVFKKVSCPQEIKNISRIGN